MRTLIIVESPAKARTLGNFLSKDYAVKASVGHIRDLPPHEMGVDVDNDFRPTYVIVEGKQQSLPWAKPKGRRAEKSGLGKPDLRNREQALAIIEELQGARYSLLKIEGKEEGKRPAPSFTTSTLQQDASKKLGFSLKETMKIA
jgi:DNA topoisomerase-1